MSSAIWTLDGEVQILGKVRWRTEVQYYKNITPQSSRNLEEDVWCYNVTLPEILGFEDGRHCSTSWTPNPTKKKTCLLPKPPRKAVLPYQKLPSQSPHFEAPMMKSMWQTPPLLSFHGSDQNPLHLGMVQVASLSFSKDGFTNGWLSFYHRKNAGGYPLGW